MKNNSKRLAVLRILLTVLLAVFLITPNITEAASVTVTQGKTKEYTVYSTGETFQVNLENAYTGTSFQGGPSWITWSGSGSSYTLTAPRNGSGSYREGYVTFRDGDRTWTVKVKQYAAVDLTVSVKFDYNGGSANIGNHTYTVGDRYEYLPVGPTPPTGHKFDGWYTAPSGGTRITEYSTVSESYKTLYAQYSLRDYAVSFNSNGGSWVANKTVKYKNYYGDLPFPSRTYYTFQGWYTDPSGGNRITSSSVFNVAADQTLYAHWTRDTVTVTFNNNGGSGNIGNKTYNVGDRYGSLPAGPTPPKGFTFDGWYTAATGGSKMTADNIAYASYPTLYAHYTANKYTLTYDSQGGSGASPVNVTYGNTYGSVYKSGTLPEPIRGNHTFLGWYTEAEGGSKITSSTKVSIAANQTLYAHWRRNTVSVSFENNGGSGTIGSRSYGIGIAYGTLPAGPTPKKGYSFDGWYTAASGGNKITENTTVSATLTVLYAHYKANTYTVSFNSMSGTSVSQKTVTYDAKYGTLTSPTRTGYTFQGWYTEKEGGSKITAESKVTIAANHTLYAHWTINQYTVTFNPNNAQAAYSKKLNYGTTLPDPAAWTGHTFGGWYTKPSGGDKVTKVTGPQTVCAHWTTNKYTITFDPCHDNLSTYTKSLDYGTALPKPTGRTGYTFAGWYTTASGGTKIETVSKQQKVYAHWTVNQYTVTFNPNNAQAAYSKKLNYGTTLPDPAAWTGHTFGGWYTKPSGGDKVTKVTGPQTVCAHWTTNKYTITFDPCHDNLSTYTKSLDYGTALPKPTGRTGYTFAGWYTTASGGTKIETVSKQQKVYAHWTVNQYTVTFNPNNAQAAYSKKLNYGTTLPDPAAWTGHTFGGWYTKPSGGDKVTKVTGPQTVCAHWTTNKYTITFDPCHDNLITYTKSLDYGTALPKPTGRTGYTFAGWYTTASGGTKIETVSKQQKVYAHWTANTYLVNFFTDGGTSVENMNVTYDSAYGTLVSPGKDGYNFKGWFTAKTGGTQVKSTTIVKTAKSHTLYARWEGKAVSIKFDVNQGPGTVPNKPCVVGEKYGSLPADPTAPTGYSFGGWYTAKTSGTKITESTIVAPSHKVIYAHWTANKYTVTYNTDGGSTVPSVIVTYGNTYGSVYSDNKLPEPKKDKYVFLGWYTAEKNGSRITEVSKISIANNHTLYAHWLATITVHFDTNGGKGTYQDRTYKPGDKYGPLPTGPASPSNDLHFVGWFTARTGGTLITEKTAVTKTYTTLYAQYDNPFFAANPSLRHAPQAKEIPYNSSIRNFEKVGYEQYMRIFDQRKDRYKPEEWSDDLYITDIRCRSTMLMNSGDLAGLFLMPEANDLLHHYFFGNGERCEYNARNIVLKTPLASQEYHKAANNLMLQMEKYLEEGQTVTFVERNTGTEDNHIEFQLDGVWDLINFNAYFGIKNCWVGSSGSCSYDGSVYKMDYYFYIQDYYTFYYEDGDTQQEGSALGLVNNNELAFLVPFGKATPYESCGIFHTSIEWTKGKKADLNVSYGSAPANPKDFAKIKILDI